MKYNAKDGYTYEIKNIDGKFAVYGEDGKPEICLNVEFLGKGYDNADHPVMFDTIEAAKKACDED
jgi:hypothetical protein